MKKKGLVLLIEIAVLILFIAVVLYFFVPGTRNILEGSSYNKYDNYNGLFDSSTSVSGNVSSGAVMEEDMIMMVSYLENVGDSQEGVFTMKNKYPTDLQIHTGNFVVSFRGYETTEENVFSINSQEEFNEYFDVKIVEPSHAIVLKKDESFKVKVRMTLKKSVPGKKVIGSINVHLKDIKKK